MSFIISVNALSLRFFAPVCFRDFSGRMVYNVFMNTVLSHTRISEAITQIAPKYDVKSVSYFGSYAAGTQTQDSDLDLLIEFGNPFISLYELIGLEMEIEEQLHIPIDIATYPLPEGSSLIIDKTVKVYGS
jgi:predicted nucleotidyltransferase